MVGFKVSSLCNKPYTAELVRVICADPNPDGPGIIEEPVSSSISGSYESREQRFYPGSWIRTDAPLQAENLSSFSMAATVFPTLIQDGVQTIMACGDISLKLHNGKLTGELGGNVVEAEAPLHVRRWYHMTLAWSQQEQKLSITQQVVNSEATVKRYSNVCQCEAFSVNAPVTIAAQLVDEHGEQCFNGKVEAPKIYGSSTGADALLAHWDFSVDISSLTIHDQGPNKLHGTIINMPARAMTGSNWDGSEMCWRHAPEQSSAGVDVYLQRLW